MAETAQYIFDGIIDLAKPAAVRVPDDILFGGDSYANKIRVTLKNNGNSVTQPAGSQCNGRVLYPNGDDTLYVNGTQTTSPGTMEIELPPEAYAAEGVVTITLQYEYTNTSTNKHTLTTVLCLKVKVEHVQGATVVEPVEVAATVNELLRHLDDLMNVYTYGTKVTPKAGVTGTEIATVENIKTGATSKIYAPKSREVYYGKCSTASATQTKSVWIDEIDSLTDGLIVAVKFGNEQGYNGTPKLNVNNFGAKDIYRTESYSAGLNEWSNGETLILTYDSTAQKWLIENGQHASHNDYGETMLENYRGNSAGSLYVNTSNDKALTPYGLDQFAKGVVTGANVYSSDSNVSYSTGDIVRHSDYLYKCQHATTGGNWNLSSWVLQDSLQEQIEDTAVYYAECSTAAGTQTKTVSIPSLVKLRDGIVLKIKFINAQTYNGTPKLFINNASLGDIYQSSLMAADLYAWNAGDIVELICTNTDSSGHNCRWVIAGQLASTVVPGRVMIETSTGETMHTGVALTPMGQNNFAKNTVTGANVYNPSISYAVGDLVRNEGYTYRCNTAIGSGGESWNPDHWTKLDPQQKQINDLEDEVALMPFSLVRYQQPTTITVNEGTSVAYEISERLGNYLLGDVVVKIHGTHNENIYISGFMGPGSLQLLFEYNSSNSAILNGRIIVGDCTAKIIIGEERDASMSSNIGHTLIKNTANTSPVITVKGSTSVFIGNMCLRGYSGVNTSVVGVLATDGSNVNIRNCQFEKCNLLVKAVSMSQIGMYDCCGGVNGPPSASNNGNSYYANAVDFSTIWCDGTVPCVSDGISVNSLAIPEVGTDMHVFHDNHGASTASQYDPESQPQPDSPT